MRAVNMHEAETHLASLGDQAAGDEPFVIAKADKPMVMAVPLTKPSDQPARRFGFLAGQFAVPDDFDQLGAAKMLEMFRINDL